MVQWIERLIPIQKSVGSIPTGRANADLCEWLKQPTWKVGVRQKRTTGSNPVVCAKKTISTIGCF